MIMSRPEIGPLGRGYVILSGPVSVGICGMRWNSSSCLGFALLLMAGQAVFAQQVSRYGLFETAVTNSRSYGNPFTGTALTAVLTSPSARQMTVEGFNDGGQTWRLRFMPDEVGSWSYTASFSDGAPGTNGGFECVAGGIHGPLQVNRSNPLWFQHADGTAFYMRAFHLWFVCRLDSRGVLLSTLDYLKSHGFNTVVGPHLSPTETLLPWVKNGSTIDFSRFDLVQWQRFDKVLAEMASRGMVLIPFNIMGGTNNVPMIDTSANRDLFLRYWVARWGGYWNATFQPIAEWEEGYSEAEVLQILNRIRELDGGRHLVSIHAWRAGSSAVQQAAAYTYHTVQDKLDAWNPTKFTWLAGLYAGASKPILAHECLWEGNLYQTEAGLDMANMRRGAWVIALSGGQINYADEVLPPRLYQTAQVYSPQFSEMGMAMAPQGWFYPYLGILGSFIRSLPFSQMTVHPELAGNGICLAEVPSRYVCYAPSGGTITLNLGASSGTLHARWLNPRAGGFTAPVSVQGGGGRTFTAPDAADWVLYVEDPTVADTTPPGPVTGLVASAGMLQNTLTWTSPTDGDVTGAIVRFSTSGYPAGPADGLPVTDESGEPGWSSSTVHAGLTRGLTYYYSVFAHDWMMNHASAAHAQAVPVGPADFDRDGDVDQADFGHFQGCLSGWGNPLAPGCENADLVPDGAIDQNDFNVFKACMTGPGQLPGC
jgi:hypothetical protein